MKIAILICLLSVLLIVSCNPSSNTVTPSITSTIVQSETELPTVTAAQNDTQTKAYLYILDSKNNPTRMIECGFVRIEPDNKGFACQSKNGDWNILLSSSVRIMILPYIVSVTEETSSTPNTTQNSTPPSLTTETPTTNNTLQEINAYLYLLDHDGNPIREFECFSAEMIIGGSACKVNKTSEHWEIGFSANVPVIILPYRIPIKKT